MTITHSLGTLHVPQPQTHDVSDKHHQSSVDTGDAELKKQTLQANRLANEQLKNHQKRGFVQAALKTLQHDNLQQFLQLTKNNISGNTPTTNLDNQEIPQLKSPMSSDSTAAKSGGGANMPNTAKTLALIGEIMQLTNETSLSRVHMQSQSYLAMMNGAEAAYSAMAAKLEQLATQWANDSDALKAAQQQANVLLADIDNAQSSVNEAMNKLAELETAAHPPISAEMQAKIDAAKKSLDSAKAKLTQVTSTYNNFVTQTLNPAITAEKSAKVALEAEQRSSNQAISTFNSQQQNIIETRRKEADPKANSLAFLMALISQLINERANDDLKAGAELKKELSEAAMNDAQKKSKEYDEQVRKAEEMQKTMGCIGKILGWVITGISFVAAAFTGGASLVFAGVGLALTAGDEIGQALTGHSFMAEAMQPIMNAVIKPLMDVIGKIFSGLLVGFGVDQKTADFVGQILGAIATSVALIAGMFLAGQAMSKVVNSVMGNIGKDVAKEVEKEAVKDLTQTLEKEAVKDLTQILEKEVAKDMSKDISKSTFKRLFDRIFGKIIDRLKVKFPKLFDPSEQQAARNINLINRTALGFDIVNGVSQTTVGIITAEMMLKAEKLRQSMILDAVTQEILNELMKNIIARFTKLIETVSQLRDSMIAVTNKNTQTSRAILQNTAAMAG